MQRFLVIVLTIGLPFLATAQPNPDTLWTRTYGGIYNDQAYSVQQTTDGGYIIAGYHQYLGGGDYYLVKTNADGDTLWTHTYGGTAADDAYCVQQTDDGGYIVVGHVYSQTTHSDEIYLVKTNDEGDTLWTRMYGGPYDDVAYSVQTTTDSGYIVAGYTYSYGIGTPANPNFYLIKTNSQGDTLWTHRYGRVARDEAYCVQQTDDGGYVLTGIGQATITDRFDFYVVKTDSQGDTLWTRTYGGSDNDYAESVLQTLNGGYVIAGFTRSFGAGGLDIYLVKTDSQGDTLWTHTYGGTYEEAGYSIEQTADGNYIVVGETFSFGVGTPDYCNCYLLKINTQGDTLWTRTYGRDDCDYGRSVQQTTDSGYIIAGYTYYSSSAYCDCYLVKTGPDCGSSMVPPEELVAWIDGDSLRLAWSQAPCATSYKVMWSLMPFDGTWSLLTSTSDTTAADIIGANEKRFYSVTAEN
jgi:hypothetical protein